MSRKVQAAGKGTPNLTTIVKQYFPDMPREPAQKSTIAFAFDIDGVLVKGKERLPGASETLRLLQKLKIPYMFLTNGGGLTEKDHAAKVSARLDVNVDPDQFVQSHSPFHDLVPIYRNRRILVVGGEGNQIRNVAEAYGFNDVITSSDLFVEWKNCHPFSEMTAQHHSAHGRPTSDLRTKEIAAILVWSSSRDWCIDLQVIHDLLLSSGGVFGKKSSKAGDVKLPNNGYLQDNQPKLYFCNPDFEWVTEYHQPRFAQGALRECLEGLWRYSTKGEAKLEYTSIGKPSETTYMYGERMLKAFHNKLCRSQNMEDPTAIRTVYMIGDNPDSDIVGANMYKSRMGATWKSILVETGVYQAGTKPNHQPTHHVKNVADAVRLALDKEGYGNSLGLRISMRVVEGKEIYNNEGRANKVDGDNSCNKKQRVLQDRTNTAESIEAILPQFGKLKLPAR
ncbi:cat eye syndrome critical region protein 5 precursor [Apiospora rasikravindrae]|uniref:Cat eye syndrome critical region protein 5 n=1 Tax=Apiospora rasikravindrae TaxID=990691 RepID=A0ABR1T6I8_9PEZI